MSAILPINIADLLHYRGVESSRVELKASWDEKTTGLQVLHTLCAFANDFQNLNGGYIVIGVREDNGLAQLPPAGLEPGSIDGIQKWIRGQCNRLDPVYQPILSPEVVNGRHILVVWAPGSDTRPHQAPDLLKEGTRKYYIRLGSETVEARGALLTQLLQLTARVPFDDRRAPETPLEKIREAKVREFLADIQSGLLEESDAREIYRRMRISARINGHEAPRNIGLLLFSDDPEEWFPGARIEVVQFAGDTSGNVIEEKLFKGPLQQQARDCLAYLRGFSTQHLEKLGDRPEVKGWVSYPLPAMEESLINALYHRSYDGEPEPTKIYLYPDRMEIISYPGPVPGLDERHFRPGESVPPVPARNRRIGELFKELRLAEGRGTGIPKVFRVMEQNGSPQPRFDFDPTRTFFRVTLPAHPEYVAISALRDAAHLRAIGDEYAALERVQRALAEQPSSGTLATALIEDLTRTGDLTAARRIFDRFLQNPQHANAARAVIAMSNAYLNAGYTQEAKAVLDRLPSFLAPQESFEAAILERRAGRQDRAHRYFERAGDSVLLDVRALHEFAQTKIKLAQEIRPSRKPRSYSQDARLRLLREAQEMLRRVLQMDAPPTRHAWAWFDLGRVLRWLKVPRSEIIDAFERAIELIPDEKRFHQELENSRQLK
jgi:ATP-dependent DNA helicase RecG